MSSVLSKPKTPKIPKPQVVEEVTQIQEDATEEQNRARRRIALTGGRESTMMYGIQLALKKRLGE